jgi:predicted CoA-substrate-specific enzyme activase
MDMGCSALKTVVVTPGGTVTNAWCETHQGDIKGALQAHLARIKQAMGGETFHFSITGEQAKTLAGLADYFSYEVPATVEGARFLDPGIGSVMEIGAQRSKFIKGFGAGARGKTAFYLNSSCASGTGSFLEEQASRLGISLDTLSATADRATKVPRIAGRCSVFSKTDMIHHQQEGAKVEDILLGLVFAMVRNFRASVVKKRTIPTPVMLAGGVVRINSVARAVKEIFGLAGHDLVIPGDPEYVGALGAAQMGKKEDRVVTVDRLTSLVGTSSRALSCVSSYPPLAGFGNGDSLNRHRCVPGTGRGYLGIDVGSTSTNLVLINESEEVMACRYLKTKGDPLGAVAQGIASLKEEFNAGLEIKATATTGSGRYLVGKELDADLVVNEITAQARGGVRLDPEVDTIIEIGGQDSKFIRIDNGTVTDFEMNKICAAGTGSFLEAQAEKIGVPVTEFSENALNGERPSDLGDRCTVFIEGSVSKAMARGESRDNLLAGLSYSIVNNYLNRVVGNRPLGKNIFLQGGIAYNQGVVNAFRSVLGKRICVPPFFSVTGALGAAVLAKGHLGKTDNPRAERDGVDLWKASETLFLQGYTGKIDPGKPTVGIPRVLFMHKLFVLFNRFFTALGFNVLLSDATDAHCVALSQECAVEETCYPVKLVNGHVASLVARGVDYIFLPSLYTMKHDGSKMRKDYACVYMQSLSRLVAHTGDFEAQGVTLLAPALSFMFGKRYMAKTIFDLGKRLGKSRIQTALAMQKGIARLMKFNRELEALGQQALAGLKETETAFVVVSRAYGVNDPELNMKVPRLLMSMGHKVLPLAVLGEVPMDRDYPNMFWPFGHHILAGARMVRQDPRLHAIYLTNHGCGPDTILAHLFEQEMGGKPYLHLEVDEHASEVGVATRLEAFVKSVSRGVPPAPVPLPGAVEGPVNPGQTLCIPSLYPFSELLCALFKANGRAAVVLPPTDAKRFARGKGFAMTKEYLSLVSLMGDVAEKIETSGGQPLGFWIPRSEGSEASGMYERLVRSKFAAPGVMFETPFLEDLLLDPQYGERFVTAVVAGDIIMAALPCQRERLLTLVTDRIRAGELTAQWLVRFAGEAVKGQKSEDGRTRLLVIGESAVVFNPFNHGRIVESLERNNRVLFQPLSEVLYCAWSDFGNGDNRAVAMALNALKTLITRVSRSLGPMTPFDDDPDRLVAEANKRLPLFSGGNGRYRVAKQFRPPKGIHGIISMESLYENSGVVVRQLVDSAGSELVIPVLNLCFDGSVHNNNDELINNFLYYL